MIDRGQLVAQVEALLRADFEAGLSGETHSAAQEVVDRVLLPALTEHLESSERERVANAVALAGRSYQAAIERQRDIINRLKAMLDSKA